MQPKWVGTVSELDTSTGEWWTWPLTTVADDITAATEAMQEFLQRAIPQARRPSVTDIRLADN